ncbi:acyltransferase [Yeosuana marina]|uniref:acyltransferase n=1 Tax=Yeosuana marina TaxID=1565536 RepID=UPI00141E26B0|nr:acyltransferase [Yeosuana marina]
MFLLNKIKYYLFVKTRILKYKLLSDNQFTGFKPKLNSPVLFSGEGEIILGDNINFGYAQSALYYSHYSYIEARTKTSRIEIGNNVVINNNFNIVSMKHIEIQDNCTIGINFSVIDSDFHHIDPIKRNAINPPSKSVKIGKNVFIGNNVTILKGVIIGDNVVIGNGSLVSSSIPINTVVAGNPARIIKTL